METLPQMTAMTLAWTSGSFKRLSEHLDALYIKTRENVNTGLSVPFPRTLLCTLTSSEFTSTQ